ncbi:MAG: 3-hydroxyadipyl-CoA dehydrogenase [Ignavibacteria bacterium]|nr:3-hydroxyadipyl-CoA dehydrogenase [Ignavibacteria bacterium]
MKKVFLIGDNEDLIKETSEFLKLQCDIADELDESADFIFELTNSGKEVKFNIMNFIDEKNTNGIIVSSSLCIPVIEQCLHSKHPGRIVGAGFYQTFSKSKGLELAKSKFTAEENYTKTKKLMEDCGKEVFEVPDKPGMISLRIISLIINEAYLVMQEGTSSREDIDTAMKLGTNYPYGPIEWSEKIGIDLIYGILKSMQEEFGEDRYRITPLLRERYLVKEIS